MKRLIIAIATAALAVAACGPLPDIEGPTDRPPAGQKAEDVIADLGAALLEMDSPLKRTTADDKAIALAFSTFDLVLSLVDAKIARGEIVRNSPKALKVREQLGALRAGLNAASSAQRRGSNNDYLAAVADARRAFDGFKRAMEGRTDG